MHFRIFSGSALAALGLLIAGCSTPRITDTGRSAVEQKLMTSVVEQAISRFRFDGFAGKKVFMEYDYLAPQVDKPFVQGYMEMHLARNGVTVVRDVKKADYILQIICGVLATDNDRFMLGTPSLPIPLPYTDMSFAIPELPIFERRIRTGYGRFAFNMLHAADRSPFRHVSGINAGATFTNWTVLLFPFKTDNFGFGDEKTGPTQTSF